MFVVGYVLTRWEQQQRAYGMQNLLKQSRAFALDGHIRTLNPQTQQSDRRLVVSDTRVGHMLREKQMARVLRLEPRDVTPNRWLVAMRGQQHF